MQSRVFVFILSCAVAGVRMGVAQVATFYSIPSGNSGVYGIALGADGAIWFTEANTNKIGRFRLAAGFQEFTVPAPPAESVKLGDITPGQDAAMWFGDISAIGRIDNAGNVTHFPTGGGPQGAWITTAPTGTIWFSQVLPYGFIGSIDASGNSTGFTVGGDSTVHDLSGSADGSVWITVSGQPKDFTNLRHITSTGQILAEFTVTPAPNAITLGPDGARWFTAGSGNIGRIDANGAIQLFTIPTANSGPADIVSGTDGALWFTESTGNKIGRITTSGSITEYALPALGSGCTTGPNRLKASSDGSIWFTEPCLNQIGHLVLAGPGTPATGQVMPFQGSGTSGTFNFTFSDSAGWQSLGVVNILINNALDGRQACYLAYSVASSTLVLVDDAGDAGGPYAGSVTLGSTNPIQNSQCSVSLVSAAGSGNDLTLTLAVNFKPVLSGNVIAYLAARDAQQANSGWQASGIWSPTQGTAGTITLGSVSPARTYSVASQPEKVTFSVTDNKGISDLGVVNLLVNNFIDGRQACYLAYVVATNTLYLVDDAGDAGGPFAGAMTLNGSGAIQNSQCTVNAQGSSAVTSGNQVTLTLQIAFSAQLAGNRIYWVAGRDIAGGNNTGWQALGTASIISD